MANTKESELEKRLVEGVRERGGVCWKFTSPGTAGVPDRICVLPGGRIIFVEMKAMCGRLRGIQRHRLNTLQKLGCDVRVIKGREALQEFIEGIGA